MRITQNQEYIAHLRKAGPPEFLRGKRILVTGASGMLGSCLVDMIMLWNREESLGCQVVAVGRNGIKLQERFHDYIEDKAFEYIAHDVCQPLENLPEQVDYIIHAASNADPANMAKYPVDTLLANVIGTKNLMEYGLSHGMKRFLFVSSGEVYGQPNENQEDFTEEYCGPISLENPRSCYPEGKRAAEVLCQCYASQRGADVVIVRPCHLFGPTMSRSDSRAAAQFLWAAAEGRDIALNSDGLKERSHCYVVDAAAAILLVLEKGLAGNAYNIADKRYQMAIRKLAEKAAEAGGCQVKIEGPTGMEDKGYLQIRRQALSAQKLEKLGWAPSKRSDDAIAKTINILRSVEESL